MNSDTPKVAVKKSPKKKGAKKAARAPMVAKKRDTIAPIITVNGDNPLTMVKKSVYVDPGATAIDNIDGPVFVKAETNVNTKKVGLYVTRFTACDAAGNTTTAERKVVVKKKATVHRLFVDIDLSNLLNGTSSSLQRGFNLVNKEKIGFGIALRYAICDLLSVRVRLADTRTKHELDFTGSDLGTVTSKVSREFAAEVHPFKGELKPFYVLVGVVRMDNYGKFSVGGRELKNELNHKNIFEAGAGFRVKIFKTLNSPLFGGEAVYYKGDNTLSVPGVGNMSWSSKGEVRLNLSIPLTIFPF